MCIPAIHVFMVCSFITILILLLIYLYISYIYISGSEQVCCLGCSQICHAGHAVRFVAATTVSLFHIFFLFSVYISMCFIKHAWSYMPVHMCMSGSLAKYIFEARSFG